MKKRIIFICTLLFISIALTITTMIVLHNNNKKEEFDDKIVSTITIDVNPSLEINLNKDNIVISVKSLNKDSDELIKDKDFSGEKLEEGIDNIVKLLKDNNYLKDDNNTIVVSVKSDNETLKETVNKTIVDKTKEKEIKTEIVLYDYEELESVKSIAEEYNITPAKAKYINEQIKDNNEIKFEELVTSPINEIEKKVEEKKELTKKEENTNTQKQNNNSGSNNSQKSTESRTGIGTKTIEDLKNEGMLESNELMDLLIQKYNINKNAEPFSGPTFSAMNDSRCKYKMAGEVSVVEGVYKHEAIMCQMDGKILEYKKTQLIDPNKIASKEEIWNVAINYVMNEKGFSQDEINDYSKRINLVHLLLGTDKILYSVHFTTKTQGEYGMYIDPITKSITNKFF